MIWLVLGIVALTVWVTVAWWLNKEPEPTDAQREWSAAARGRAVKQNVTVHKPERRYL